MQESRLWLLNHVGHAFTISTKQTHFTQLKNTFDDAVTVKRVSASSSCAWAIGHDHRVYIYIFSSDVPIRVAETTYENQRWTPIHGYSRKSLIPTDRNAWSDENGIGDRPKESVRLPSSHWQWEGNWFIDENLRGEVVGIGGWQYALDFPAVYSPEKHWNSFVRKRKWIRFRRFISTDTWARISDMEVADKAECFIDISVGGFFMPIETPGTISVWGVTNNGNIYVRTNTHHDKPEGDSWLEIGLIRDHGVINISVGVSNLVWAITWDGHAVVRTNVTRNNIYGTGWELVQYPNENTRLMQVAVGRNAVWALSREGKVWFRKGTWGDDVYGNIQSAVGTMWVEMVGEMLHIAVSANDQVFAIEKDTRRILFRTSVTHSDLTGKTWQSVSLQEDLSLLEKEGRISAGIVCSCSEGDDSTCEYHRALHREISYGGSSSSSLSQMNADESSNSVFLSPTDSYPSFSLTLENDEIQKDTKEVSTDQQQQCKSAIISLTDSHQLDATLSKNSDSMDDPSLNHARTSEETLAKAEEEESIVPPPPTCLETRSFKADEGTQHSTTPSNNKITKEYLNTHPHKISSSETETEEPTAAGMMIADSETVDACLPFVPIKSPLAVEEIRQSPLSKNLGGIDRCLNKNQSKTDVNQYPKDSEGSPEDNQKRETATLRDKQPKNTKKKSPKKHHDLDSSSSAIVYQEKKPKKKPRFKQSKSQNDKRDNDDKSLCGEINEAANDVSTESAEIENAGKEVSTAVKECLRIATEENDVECEKVQVCSSDYTKEKQTATSNNFNSHLHENSKDQLQDGLNYVHPASSSQTVKENAIKEDENAVPDQTDNQNTETAAKRSHLFHIHTDSLDSTNSVSDEIIDFVTDLISDEEDGNNDVFPSQAAKGKEIKHSYSLEDSKDSTDTLVSSQVPQHEVIPFSTVGSHSSSTKLASCQMIESYSPSKCDSSALYLPVSHILNSQSEDIPQFSAFSVSQDQRSPSAGFDSSCSESGSSVIPFYTIGLAQSRLSWRWLDVTSCLIGNPASVPWLLQKSQKSTAKSKRIAKISLTLRNDILEKLKSRNKQEIQTFSNIELAIEKQTWVKCTKMHIFLYGHHNRWIPCNVEFEQGIADVEESCLTLQYCQKNSQKNIQVKHDEIICIKMSSNLDDPSIFLIHSSISELIYQPLMLRASSEAEALEWVGYLCMANVSKWKVDHPISPGVAWSCTTAGDVFVSIDSMFNKKPYDFCWSQHGGHMSLIETGPSGVTWALGFNKMPYVYNGGYGGAVNQDATGMSDNLQDLVDLDRINVYENQKWFPVLGWCNKGVLSSDFNWLTPSGKSVASREDVKLPSSKWQWVSDWTVDFNSPGGVNSKGWQFSTNLYGHFHADQHMRDYYRRRRWTRTCRLTTQGPWQAGGSLKLLDISVQIDPAASSTDAIVLWAVGANGDVLCRSGVTVSNPEGESWNHVATFLDKPYRSISVGGGYRVWGIASDGSAWFRAGVSKHNHSGKCWLQVVPPPPGNNLLKQVSAGASTVWAVDTGDGLWRRENITTTFPEGTGWEFVASRVRRVSVGPKDQVWIVAAARFGRFKHDSGVIYKRMGITEKRPSGIDWTAVIGSGWSHVSVRGINK